MRKGKGSKVSSVRVNNGTGEAAEAERRLKVHAEAMRSADKTVRVPGVVSTVVPGMSEGRTMSPKRYEQMQREKGWTGDRSYTGSYTG